MSEMNSTKRIFKTGVVGCGAISDIYLQNMINVFDGIEVVACTAAHMENAIKKAEQYQLQACTLDEMLANPEIEMIVVLTPAPTHYEIIKKALLAGKHVYTEKSMTIDPATAKELVDLANEKKLYLGSAPDTFLGAAYQNAKKAIQEGLIGEVTSFHISANRNLDFLAAMFKFLCMPGGGVCYDYGVYYLTALVSLLGPVDKVSALVSNRAKERINTIPGTIGYNEPFIYDNESQVQAIVSLESGVRGTFSLNGDSIANDLADFMIYGTKGVLKLTDPNQFGGDVILIKENLTKEPDQEVICYTTQYSKNSRGLGPAEMAEAISENRVNRANKERAYHVLDIVSTMMKSNETGCFEKVESTCEKD